MNMQQFENFQPPVSQAKHEENLDVLKRLGEERLAKELADCGVVDPKKLAEEILESPEKEN